MDLQYLNSLTKEFMDSLDVNAIPYEKILEDSLYYPASGNDGGPVKYMNTKYKDLKINSFVYCDYMFGPRNFFYSKETFRGYHLVGCKIFEMDSPQEMVSLLPDWEPVVPPMIQEHRYVQAAADWKPFIGWAIYERDGDKDESFGPSRFSLLYVGGEGVASYEALYWNFRIVPKAIAFVQDGAGFGGNYTKFTNISGPMKWVIYHHPEHRIPKYILCGGVGLPRFEWPGFKPIDSIHNYYRWEYGVAEMYQYFGENR